MLDGGGVGAALRIHVQFLDTGISDTGIPKLGGMVTLELHSCGSLLPDCEHWQLQTSSHHTV